MDLVAAWDFSIGISTDRMVDVSPRHLHGVLINLPTRGVTGRHGGGDAFCWVQTPERYAAVHFHDDDLYDAGWDGCESRMALIAGASFIEFRPRWR